VRGQEPYLATCKPRSPASIVIDNDDLDAPRLLEA